MSFIQKQQLLQFDDCCQPVQAIQYNPGEYSKELFSNYHIQPPSQLDEWVEKRQAQFLAGRIAARYALNTIKLKQDKTYIGIGTHREPIWPDGIAGSISHYKNIAFAIAKQQKTGGLGLDIQTIFDDRQTHKIIKLILSPSDQVLFETGISGLSGNQLATLIFSAKESFFKAVFKQVGDYFDFNVVSIKSLDVQAGLITLSSDIDLSETIKPENTVNIVFKILAEYPDRIMTLLS